MNSPPLPFMRRAAYGPSIRAERPRYRMRVENVPPEVYAARAFARLAGIDLDELGVTGRPPCTQPHVTSSTQHQEPKQKVGPSIRKSVAWARRLGLTFFAWLRAKVA